MDKLQRVQNAVERLITVKGNPNTWRLVCIKRPTLAIPVESRENSRDS